MRFLSVLSLALLAALPACGQSIGGTTFKGPASVLNIVPPSGDTTGATDVTNVLASCTTYHNAQLTSGHYYINRVVNLTMPCRIIGAGSTTIVTNKGTTNDWFRISYFTAWSLSPWVYPTSTDQSEIAFMQFDQVGTATAGYIFNIGSGLQPSGGTYSYTMNVHVHNTVANNAWGGAYFGTHELYAFVDHNVWRNFVGGGAIYSDADIGSGDNHVTDNEFSGLTYSGIIITKSDTQMFAHDKLNGSGIRFTGAGAAQTVQFTDMSIETGITQPCMIDFGTGTPPANIQFNGGETIGFTTLVCHPSNVNGWAFTIANSGGTNDYAAGLVTNNGWRPLPTAQANGLADASMPTFTPAAGSYVSTQSTTITCAAGTPYYKIGSGAVTQYTTALSVNATETINAGCYGNGLNPVTTSAAYTIGAGLQDHATFSGSSGTLLSAYTTSAGKTFALYTNSGISPVMPQLGGSNTAILASGGDSTFGDVLDTLTPATPNYTVSATYFISTGGPVIGVYARADSASNTNYIAQFSSGILQLYSQHGGSTVTLGTVGFSWPSGQTHTISLTVNGSTISAAIDGTGANLGPYTDTGVTAAGQAGLRITGGSNAILTDFFVQ